jgi:hypothetical protein
MKTIEEIGAELREYADADTDSQVVDREVLRRKLHFFADSLKDAHRQEISQAYMRGLREGVRDFVKKMRRSINKSLSEYGIVK